jgi:hypothetical protein
MGHIFLICLIDDNQLEHLLKKPDLEPADIRYLALYSTLKGQLFSASILGNTVFIPEAIPLSTTYLKSLKLLSALRIRIRTDPHHFAESGSGILEADPDLNPNPRLQNWHLINFFSVEKYCEYINANFSVHK